MKSSKADSDSKKSSKGGKSSEIDESPPKSRGRASPSRSPARSRKVSPGPKSGRKSPSRKSPSRKSPSRKSPSRKPPSPSRKSPSRSAKDIDEPPKSPSRRPAIKTESNVEVKITKMETTKLAQAQRKLADVNGGDGLRERKVKSDESSAEASKIGARRSIRIKAANENFDKLLSLAQSTKLPKTDEPFETFSDGDEEDSSPQKSRSRKLLTPTKDIGKSAMEFGGRFGVVCMFIFSLGLVAGVNVACNKTQCNFKSLPNLQQFKQWNVWFSLRSLLIYSSYLLLHTALYFIPCCGKKITLADSGVVFTANGLFILTIILANMLVLEYFSIPIFRWIYEEYYALFAWSVIVSVLLALCVYIKSRKVPDDKRNPYGNSGSFIYDFWMGREVNVYYFKSINVKLLTVRAASGLCIILDIIYLYLGTSVKNFPIISNQTILELDTYKHIAGAISINPTLFAFVSFQLLYLIYNVAQEKTFPYMFEYQYEGTGFLALLGYAIYPFTTMIINKCILEHNIRLNPYILAAAIAIGLIGLYIFHVSNTEKSMFRANPMDPKLAHLDSIPTFHGKRLLVSGWWGFVRHPNYLGDILVHLSWATPVLCEPPLLFIVATVLYLLSRAHRDGQRCSKRYGAAWERYCRRVPYNLLPKVF